MTAEPHPFVLMIDDDADFLEVTEMAISQKGYATAVARNGRDGLRLFQQHNPHLVILDLGMPRMDGLETLQLIRQSSECPVIILTGNTSVGLFLQALDLGVHDYLIKGMSLQALTERVGMTLERLGCAEPYGCETGERADSSPC